MMAWSYSPMTTLGSSWVAGRVQYLLHQESSHPQDRLRFSIREIARRLQHMQGSIDFFCFHRGPKSAHIWVANQNHCLTRRRILVAARFCHGRSQTLPAQKTTKKTPQENGLALSGIGICTGLQGGDAAFFLCTPYSYSSHAINATKLQRILTEILTMLIELYSECAFFAASVAGEQVVGPAHKHVILRHCGVTMPPRIWNTELVSEYGGISCTGQAGSSADLVDGQLHCCMCQCARFLHLTSKLQQAQMHRSEIIACTRISAGVEKQPNKNQSRIHLTSYTLCRDLQNFVRWDAHLYGRVPYRQRDKRDAPLCSAEVNTNHELSTTRECVLHDMTSSVATLCLWTLPNDAHCLGLNVTPQYHTKTWFIV